LVRAEDAPVLMPSLVGGSSAGLSPERSLEKREKHEYYIKRHNTATVLP